MTFDYLVTWLYVTHQKRNISFSTRPISKDLGCMAPNGDELELIKLCDIFFSCSCEVTLDWISFSYSSSYNLALSISLFLIGWHLIFCSPLWPTCCNSPRKYPPVEYMVMQKAGFQIVTKTTFFPQNVWSPNFQRSRSRVSDFWLQY